MAKQNLPIKWVGRASRKGNADVSLTICHNSDTRECVSFTFRNSSYEFFTRTDYFKVGIFKNRLFFTEAKDFDGLLLNKNKETTPNTRYARIASEKEINLFRPFEGAYELKYDEFYELYYIEKENETDED